MGSTLSFDSPSVNKIATRFTESRSRAPPALEKLTALHSSSPYPVMVPVRMTRNRMGDSFVLRHCAAYITKRMFQDSL
jgi:hypothetical protein